jgi:hypothetical protein
LCASRGRVARVSGVFRGRPGLCRRRSARPPLRDERAPSYHRKEVSGLFCEFRYAAYGSWNRPRGRGRLAAPPRRMRPGGRMFDFSNERQAVAYVACSGGLSQGSSTSASQGMSACLNVRQACASVIDMISYLSACLRLRELGRLGVGPAGCLPAPPLLRAARTRMIAEVDPCVDLADQQTVLATTNGPLAARNRATQVGFSRIASGAGGGNHARGRQRESGLWGGGPPAHSGGDERQLLLPAGKSS